MNIITKQCVSNIERKKLLKSVRYATKDIGGISFWQKKPKFDKVNKEYTGDDGFYTENLLKYHIGIDIKELERYVNDRIAINDITTLDLSI